MVTNKAVRARRVSELAARFSNTCKQVSTEAVEKQGYSTSEVLEAVYIYAKASEEAVREAISQAVAERDRREGGSL